MTRIPEHRYLDPLDAIWLHALAQMGLEVRRSSEVFAALGEGRLLHIGETPTLDDDDCLAQLLVHEVCHSLIEGPDSLDKADWGIDSSQPGAIEHEWAALRLQAALLRPWGLEAMLAPTTEHRAYYFRHLHSPLGGEGNEGDARQRRVIAWAQTGLHRSRHSPWAPHLTRALEVTATIARCVSDYGAATYCPGGQTSLWSRFSRRSEVSEELVFRFESKDTRAPVER